MTDQPDDHGRPCGGCRELALMAEVERLHTREAALIRAKDVDLDDVRDVLDDLMAALDVDQMASVIWEASRADEGTISATGAKFVAETLRAHVLGLEPKTVA